MTTEDAALLPCPFCDDAAPVQYARRYPIETDCDSVHVYCGTCDAVGPDYLVDMGDTDAEQNWPEAHANAIAAWNIRAGQSASDAGLLEALGGLMRCLLPVHMALMQRELVDDPLPREAVLFSHMGSGCSDSVTVGEYQDATEAARAAIAAAKGEKA